MTDYEFRCEACNIVMVKDYHYSGVPRVDLLFCPRCDKKESFVRLFSFGVGGGDNGERPRSS